MPGLQSAAIPCFFYDGEGMTRFATALADDGALGPALDRAIEKARAEIDDEHPSLAVVFASKKYEGIGRIDELLRARLPGVPFVGGTAGSCIFDGTSHHPDGVSVSLVSGDDLCASTRAVATAGGELLEVADAARDIRAEARAHEQKGRPELACLAFAPSHVTGDTLVAALKKGATTHAQLAGALLSSEDEHGLVWSDGGGTSESAIVVAGLFSARPIGVAARHGWRRIGESYRVTRAEGSRLVSLDGRPALDVWLHEARAHGGEPPPGHLAQYLASRYELAIEGTEGRPGGEPIVRGSRRVHEDGAVDLFGSVPEGARVHLVTATEDDLYEAAREAARSALANAGGRISGALGLMCIGRSHVLGARYPNEPRAVAEALGLPFGGTTVHGEIALGRRDANGFYNSTAVVVAFPE